MSGVRVGACLEHAAEPEGCIMNIIQDSPRTVPNQYVKCVHSNYLTLFPDRKEEEEFASSPLIFRLLSADAYGSHSLGMIGICMQSSGSYKLSLGAAARGELREKAT